MSVHDFWTPFALEPFISALIIGLSLASIWLVAALGLTIIYGTMGVINMAHGEFIMLGAYITWILQYFLGFPWLLCLPISFVIVAFVGWLVERGLIRHLYDRPLDTLLATWGVSLVFIQSIRLIFGGEPQYIDTPEFLSSVVEIGFLYIPTIRIFIFGIAICVPNESLFDKLIPSSTDLALNILLNDSIKSKNASGLKQIKYFPVVIG